jgi:hypothetical protein
MSLARKHTKRPTEELAEKTEREDRDPRRPLKDGEVEELLAVIAKTAVEAAPKTKNAAVTPPRVNPPESWPSTRTLFAALPDKARRAALLLLVLDEGVRLEAQASLEWQPHGAVTRVKGEH